MHLSPERFNRLFGAKEVIPTPQNRFESQLKDKLSVNSASSSQKQASQMILHDP
jgi:hypothetical protein